MTGYLTTIQDQVWRLPVLTAWEILRTDGESCDSFFVRFAFEAAQLTTLRQAVPVPGRGGGRDGLYRHCG